MKQELVFEIKNNNDSEDMRYFKTNKKPIIINEVHIKKIVLCNKASYGEHGANE